MLTQLVKVAEGSLYWEMHQFISGELGANLHVSDPSIDELMHQLLSPEHYY